MTKWQLIFSNRGDLFILTDQNVHSGRVVTLVVCREG